VACFERARRLEEAARELPAEIARARVRVAGLEKLEARAKDASSDPGEIEEEARAAGLLDERQEGDPRKKKPPPPRLPYRSFRASSGAEIRVGRNARDNDDLTFRHARGNDLWLHTADVPGSHVVLRLEKGVEPAQEDLLDAAHLAVHFSPQRGARRAGVHVARRKEVHKPRGAPPGLVSLSGGRHLDLRLEPERLQRLLGPDRPPGPPEVAGS
jgi:predicted ribosome quality control (RQC) complex YloA/Tae2 family protein